MADELKQFSDLVGHTLKSVTGAVGDDEIVFELESGEKYCLYHSQDCCEVVEVEDICGDLADLAATFGDLMTCDSFLKCFTELGGAAVDAVIVDKPVAVSYAAENAGFTVLDEGLGAEQYGIAFRADDAELCKTIEGAVAQLVENGTYAEIAAKYPDIQNNLTLLG